MNAEEVMRLSVPLGLFRSRLDRKNACLLTLKNYSHIGQRVCCPGTRV